VRLEDTKSPGASSAPRARKVHAPQVTVRVDKPTIAASMKADSSHCMIAEAIRLSVPKAANISVDLQTIRFTDRDKGARYTYLTPRIVQLALVSFDMGSRPDPFQFQLRSGQVTRSGSKIPAKPRHQPDGPTPAQVAARAKAQSFAPSTRARLQRDSAGSIGSGNDRTVPSKVGGRTPPVQKVKTDSNVVPFSRRRQFGLRALDRAPQVDVIE
jgi:hypothetical protein